MTVEDKDFIGKVWPQNCGDSLLVVEKTNEKKFGAYLFKCQFQKYSYEILESKDHVLRGVVINPQILQNEFIDKLWYQNESDDYLRIIERYKSNRWICEFISNGFRVITSRERIEKGIVKNEKKIDDNFIGNIYPQNCGDNLKVISKTEYRNKGSILYKCQFQKYPYEVLKEKSIILKGNVDNPQIEQVEFINKIWPQNCGDNLIVVEKTDKKLEDKTLFKCRFQKYPCEVLVVKQTVIEGTVANPQIEQVEFIDKLWLQHCGDTLKILKKDTNKKINNEFFWQVQFLKYPCTLLARKNSIVRGKVDNPALPWKSKEGIENFIKNNFENKCSLIELSQKMNISQIVLGRMIAKYDELKKYISYSYTQGEKEILSFLEPFKIGNIVGNKTFKKDNKYKEIDIFISEFNLGIEYNGNYWHCNIFQDSKSHQQKSLWFKDINIRIFHVFEYEWSDINKQRVLKDIIKKMIGIFDKRIYARKCEIKNLSNQEYQNFCIQNHLQGSAGAKVKLGLFLNNELIQVMSFGSPRFTDKFEWEIIRECSKLGYKILGGKQKLWNYFVKNYIPKSVISYCDFSKFTGNSYLKLGFKLERLNKPGFVWYDKNIKQIFWRSPENHQKMKEKYYKIYDCGQLVFSWVNK